MGLGAQAEKIAAALQISRNGTLMAAASKDRARAESFAKKHGAKVFFSDYKKMLKERDVDAVFVASPNNLHKNQALAALAAGKHVLCEKPLALSHADGRAMVKRAQESKLILGTGFHLRFHPLMQEIRTLIHKKFIGELVSLDMHWSVGIPGATTRTPFEGHMRWRDNPREAGGGAVMARGVHMFDLLRFLTGDEVTRVMAHTDATSKTVDTFATGIFQMSRGAVATLTTSRKIPYPKNELVIYGNKGRIVAHDAFTTNFSGTLEVTEGERMWKKTAPQGNAYVQEIEDFGDAVLANKKPASSGEDGLRTVLITEAFVRSTRLKKEIAVAKIT